MIKGLFETHLYVENLEISTNFYKNVLSLEQCHHEEGRRVTFFWIGKPQEAMLGLWEKPKSQIERRHFAFQCDKDFILYQASNFLLKHDIQSYNFLKNGSTEPIVFAWMPAISIYFDDPDGHILEFIAILDGMPKPELGVISYGDWKNINQ